MGVSAPPEPIQESLVDGGVFDRLEVPEELDELEESEEPEEPPFDLLKLPPEELASEAPPRSDELLPPLAFPPESLPESLPESPPDALFSEAAASLSEEAAFL
jgi:hypothetical protein